MSRNPIYRGRHGGGEPGKKVPPKQALREFQDLIWPRRGLLGGGLVLVLINRVAGLVLPGSVKYLIDDIVTPGNLALLTPLVVIVRCVAEAGCIPAPRVGPVDAVGEVHGD